MTTATVPKYKYDFKIHPLAQLFPDLPKDEFEKLKRDIEVHGQQEPVMLSADGETVLDGRHRLRACKELGIQPRIEQFMALLADTSKGTVYRPGKGWVKGLPYSEADYIWSRNVLRRHLTADQRAALAHKWADAERQTAKERQKQHGGTAPGRPGNTPVESNKSVREALAEKAQVSTHKIQQTEVLAKKAPELLPRVAAGEMKLKEAVKKLNEGLFNPEKRQTETASKPKEPRAQKDDGDAVAIAVNGAIKQIEKYIREVRRSVRANQHATYDTAVAARLEVLAKQLRGRTPNQTIDLTIDEDRSKFP